MRMKDGSTALHLAAQNGRAQLVKELVRGGLIIISGELGSPFGSPKYSKANAGRCGKDEGY